MLEKILFAVSPALTASLSVQKLLQALESSGIDAVNYVDSTPAFASPTPNITPFEDTVKRFALSPDTCLIITDTAAGAHAAKLSGIPCIGYAPAGGCEDFSCAYALFEDFASVDVAYLCRTHAHAMGYPADILTTERLRLHEFSEADFPALFAMCTPPATASMMEESLSDYETEREKHLAYIRTVYPLFDLALWGVFEKDSGCLIGRAGFSLPEDSSDTFSLGYLIDVPYRRQGYAKELIPALLSYASEQGYTEVSARIKKENIISVKVLEQCGFPYERKEHANEGIITYLIHLKE